MVGGARLYICACTNFVGFGDLFDQPFVIRGWHGMSVKGDKFMELKRIVMFLYRLCNHRY